GLDAVVASLNLPADLGVVLQEKVKHRLISPHLRSRTSTGTLPWSSSRSRSQALAGAPPCLSFCRLRRAGLLFEDDEIILLEQFRFLTQLAEAGLQDLGLENILAGADVIQHPVAAGAGDAVKVDQHHSPTWLERSVQRRHGFLWEFKVVVGVTD